MLSESNFHLEAEIVASDLQSSLRMQLQVFPNFIFINIWLLTIELSFSSSGWKLSPRGHAQLRVLHPWPRSDSWPEFRTPHRASFEALEVLNPRCSSSSWSFRGPWLLRLDTSRSQGSGPVGMAPPAQQQRSGRWCSGRHRAGNTSPGSWWR